MTQVATAPRAYCRGKFSEAVQWVERAGLLVRSVVDVGSSLASHCDDDASYCSYGSVS